MTVMIIDCPACKTPLFEDIGRFLDDYDQRIWDEIESIKKRLELMELRESYGKAKAREKAKKERVVIAKFLERFIAYETGTALSSIPGSWIKYLGDADCLLDDISAECNEGVE